MITQFPLVELSDVTERITTWNRRRHSLESIRYIDVSAVSRDELAIVDHASHSSETAPARAQKILQKHDTLFATIRPGLRRVAFVPPVFDGAIASTAFCVLRPSIGRIDPHFLFYAVIGESFVRRVEELQTGASYPAVRDRDVLQQCIPLPPLPEQSQIAAALTIVRKAVLCEKRAIGLTQRTKSTAMRDLFTGGRRGEPRTDTDLGPLPARWHVLSLGELGRIGSGTTPNRTEADFWSGGTIPWITSGRMYEREITGADECVTQKAIAEAGLPLLKPGAVLIAIVGQGKTLGHCAILRVEATVSRHVGYVQSDSSRIVPEYLRGFLESRYEYLRQLASGNGSTRAALTGAILKTVQVPVPPTLEEQQEIAAILASLDAKIDLHRRKAAVLDELFNALLQKLMTGQIRAADLDMSAIAEGALAGTAS